MTTLRKLFGRRKRGALRTAPLRGITHDRMRVMTPQAFVRLSRLRPEMIKSVQVVPPTLGDGTYGYLKVITGRTATKLGAKR